MRELVFIKAHLLKIALVVILILGFIVFAFLIRSKQNLSALTTQENVAIDFISPKPGLSVLGTTAIRARIQTTDPALLKAQLRVDGTVDKDLLIEQVDNNSASISGIWENSKSSPGDHNLEIYIYNEKTNPPTLVGKTTVMVRSVSP